MPIGPWEIVILLVILVIIFGAGRLAQVGGALGKSVREFRGAMGEEPKATAPPAAAVPAAPPVICATCQSANPAGQKFCSSCGGSLLALAAAANPPVAAAEAVATAPEAHTPETPHMPASTADALHVAASPAAVPVENTCPSCATVNPPGQPFCGQCGTRLTRAA